MEPSRIYDKSIVDRRKERQTPAGKSLWEYANFYFQARNPMLYRVRHEKHDVVVLRLRPDILKMADAYISVGNAAAIEESEICPVKDGFPKLLKKQIWNQIHAKYWNNTDSGKRIIMSELLIPDNVPAEYVDGVYVPDNKTKTWMEALPSAPPVIVEPDMFFLPSSGGRISDNISLVEGDMFFSSRQTFTISVNTGGIMGKGLASRTKYQFPDVYVKYQDACRRKLLTPQKPYLYKRESSLDSELADMPEHLKEPNASRWFLLFATKRSWRDDSRLADIESGLQWIAENYEKEGIKSLALPALGCGLGNLSWAEVGPLMCRLLSQISIHSAIYLPRETAIPAEQKTAEFLLGKTNTRLPQAN